MYAAHFAEFLDTHNGLNVFLNLSMCVLYATLCSPSVGKKIQL